MHLKSLLRGSSTVTIFVVIVLCSSVHGLKVRGSGQKSPATSRANVEGEKIERFDQDVTDKGSVEGSSNNSTLMSFLHLDKLIAPRYIEQLTNSFNAIGVPGSVMSGIALLVLLPIYLGAVFLGWLPLQKVLFPAREEPDYSSYYKAPAPASANYYGESSKPPMYGWPAASAPSPSPQYGWAEAPAPKSNYGYAESAAPSISYGYQSAPAPSPMFGGYSSAPAPAPSPSYGYSPSIPDHDPTPSTSYGYSAIIPSQAPSSQYGEPAKPSPAYTILDSDSKTVKSDVKVSARKARSIRTVPRLNDEQCVERLACELSKATKGIRVPDWMRSMADVLPLKDNSIVEEAKKLLSVSNRCARFRCDSYDIWGQY